ncbi:MAG: bifunctional YncE family protein/alkaline phosphatase family protein [Acidobacteriia bacterium]|nr:bifunctional YncE family protein/alkaline phosphatase family protein [Terriglobia bacterium]
MRRKVVTAAALILAIAGFVYSQKARVQTVGRTDDGSFLLNTGWRIRPAGKNIPLSTLPMSHVLAPDGRMLAVLNGGYMPSSVSLVDLETTRESARVTITDGWRGLAFSPLGDKLYAGNGARGSVTQFSVSGGSLAVERKIDLYPAEKPGAPHLIADIVAGSTTLLVADGEQDKILVVDPVEGKVLHSIAVARNPYSMLLSPDGTSVFVSSWSTAQVSEYRLSDGKEMARIPVGAHPTEMLWLPASEGQASDDDDDDTPAGTSPRLAVTCANTNFVYVLEKRGTAWRVKEKINVALTPRQPVGMTPSSLSLSPDKHRLFVACSDANAVAVVDVTGAASKVLGFVPTGWYPTAVRSLRDGRLLVLNGKGLGSHPNPNGPNPFRWPTPAPKVEYVAAMQEGSASVIGSFDHQELDAYTKTVLENSPYRDALLQNAGIARGNPVPDTPGGPTPIKHVILLMKENRTYDQVLGDMKEGNGDPSLVLFGEKVTPNHHKLAREFVLLDNFYVNADVSADGFYWTTAAIAPDSNQKTWPMSYARRVYARGSRNPEGTRQAPGGHIWDKAAEAGVSFYNYGFTAINLPHPPDAGIQIRDVQDPILKPRTSYYFRQHDRSFSDINRIQVFLHDLAEWEKKGDMPRLVLMTIGNDHTEGTTPGIRSPISCVADNDQSVGVMVEGLTKSKFWGSTAMFILEDDAQDGADHVDSHRSPAYVISPYTRRGVVDSTLYNTTSVLRTIELILGLKPMTVFDAAARPMANVFVSTPSLTHYQNELPRVPLDDKNPVHSATAARSLKLDFSQSDLADEHELNDILWIAIKGTTPPPTVHSRFAQ